MKNGLLREATHADAAALDAFLAQYAETSMFLRGNLQAHGFHNREHRHGTTYWLYEPDGISAVVGCSNGGYLMCQAPDADAAFWCAASDVLAERRIEGITGVPEQVNAWADALDLAASAFSVKETEPLYKLSLDRIMMPDISGLSLRRPVASDAALLAEWFDGYARDTGITPTDGASGHAAAAVFIQHEAARILELNGLLVAMTSLNARVADIVQVGGVFVPKALRGHGLGGAVVALQLADLAQEGVQTAILFAANAAAARAYERIGFDLIGRYEIALLKSPTVIKRTRDVFQA